MSRKLRTCLFMCAIMCTNIAVCQSVNQGKSDINQPKAAHVPSTDLTQEIILADSLLFKAFNTCDFKTYQTYFTDDLEFYHDLGGLTVSLAKEMESIKAMCARNKTPMRRELIKSSLEVYPLKGYGAVEIGVHRFYHTNPGQPEKLSGTYKFVHVWQQKDGHWKISRVISYGHENMTND